MAHNSDTSAAGHRSETVYHPGPDSVVTSVRIDTANGRFLVRDLARIQCVYEYAHPVRTIALICGGLEMALALPLAAAYGALSVVCAGLLAAAGIAAAIMADSHQNPKWMVLVAVHRGRAVTLYRSRDRQQFEQVRRAVLRAVQAAGRPEWGPGTAVMVPAEANERTGSDRARPRRYARRPTDRS